MIVKLQQWRGWFTKVKATAMKVIDMTVTVTKVVNMKTTEDVQSGYEIMSPTIKVIEDQVTSKCFAIGRNQKGKRRNGLKDLKCHQLILDFKSCKLNLNIERLEFESNPNANFSNSQTGYLRQFHHFFLKESGQCINSMKGCPKVHTGKPHRELGTPTIVHDQTTLTSLGDGQQN